MVPAPAQSPPRTKFPKVAVRVERETPTAAASCWTRAGPPEGLARARALVPQRARAEAARAPPARRRVRALLAKRRPWGPATSVEVSSRLVLRQGSGRPPSVRARARAIRAKRRARPVAAPAARVLERATAPAIGARGPRVLPAGFVPRGRWTISPAAIAAARRAPARTTAPGEHSARAAVKGPVSLAPFKREAVTLALRRSVRTTATGEGAS